MVNFKTRSKSLCVPSAAAHNLPIYPPLDTVTRSTISTDEAAYYLHLRPQTMRAHACKQTLGTSPLRISGRLHWRTSDISALLNGSAI